MPDLEPTPVVTCFLRSGGDVLLLRRSHEVGSYRGRWGAVAGHVQGDPLEDARREIDEETGLLDDCALVRAGEPFAVDDEELGRRWLVHPFLFDCEAREPKLDWESVEASWRPAHDILELPCVPQLWRSYERVAPSVESIRDDREHGSAYLSLRALEVLRDRAAVAIDPSAAAGDESGDRSDGGSDAARRAPARNGQWAELCDLASRLLEARPAMTALHNRVHRAMWEANGEPSAVRDAAHEGIERALRVDRQAASEAAVRLRGQRVLTLSRSGSVLEALRAAAPSLVVVAVSDPLGEGRGVAEELARAGIGVALCADASMAHAVAAYRVDAVAFGADTVLRDGAVVNKVGTRLAALAAADAGIPAYAVAASDKIAVADEIAVGDEIAVADADARGGRGGTRAAGPRAPRGSVYRGGMALEIDDALFETTPARLVTAVITDRGTLGGESIAALADEHARMRVWRDWPIRRRSR